jgi:peptidoglycan/LPS O-acetylase OafA/YrhL
MNKVRRLYELDALRGIAALAVCLFHFNFLKYGVTGVDLFFMISGFVIFMSITNAKSLKEFWIARVARLYPVYWLSMLIASLVCTACILALPPLKFSYVISNLLMLQPLFKVDYFVGVSWTLYIEMLFYLFVSALWLTKQFKNIELVILICLILSGITHTSFLFLQNTSSSYNRIFIFFRGLFPLISHFHLFAAGMIFYQVHSKGINFNRVALLAFAFVMAALTHSVGGRVFYFLNVYQHLACILVFYLAFSLIISGKGKFLSLKFMVLLGDISYPLYLVHGTIGIYLGLYLLPKSGTTLSSIMGILASLIASYIITFYFDIPIRRWLKKKLLVPAPPVLVE